MGKVVRFGPRKPANEYQRRKWNPRRPKRRWSSKLGRYAILAGLVSVPVAAEVGPPLVGCTVKGNISYNTGERIYHVPGQEHYWETRINWLSGERWFCSEEAARAAGWRKAMR